MPKEEKMEIAQRQHNRGNYTTPTIIKKKIHKTIAGTHLEPRCGRKNGQRKHKRGARKRCVTLHILKYLADFFGVPKPTKNTPSSATTRTKRTDPSSKTDLGNGWVQYSTKDKRLYVPGKPLRSDHKGG